MAADLNKEVLDACQIDVLLATISQPWRGVVETLRAENQALRDREQAAVAAATQRGYTKGLKDAEDIARRVNGTEGLIDKRTQNLIGTAIGISVAKNQHLTDEDATAALNRIRNEQVMIGLRAGAVLMARGGIHTVSARSDAILALTPEQARKMEKSVLRNHSNGSD